MRVNSQNINACEEDWYTLTVCPSSPDPRTYAGLPSRQNDWGCGQWRVYFDNNITYLGRDAAVKILYNDIDNQPLTSDWRFCYYDCSFMDYLNKNGVDVKNLFTNISCTLSNVTNTIRYTAKSGMNLAKYGVPFIALGLIGYALYKGGAFNVKSYKPSIPYV